MKIVILLAALSQMPNQSGSLLIGTSFQSLRAYLDGLEMIEAGRQLSLDNRPKECLDENLSKLKRLLLKYYLVVSYAQRHAKATDVSSLRVSEARAACLAAISEKVLAQRLRHKVIGPAYLGRLREAMLAYQETHRALQLDSLLYRQAEQTLQEVLKQIKASHGVSIMSD